MGWRVMPSRALRTVMDAGEKLYKVIYVCDGDCLAVAGGPHGQAREYIRLLCIDTPESYQECYGESKAALEDLVKDRMVRLEPEHKWRFVRDRYGRCLCYVFVEDLLVNAELIRLGWSDYVTKFGRGRYQHTLDACKSDAELHRRGVWRRYKRGDSWAWGRGRSKPHFRNAVEFDGFQRGESKGRVKADGKVPSNFGGARGVGSGQHVQSKPRGPVREAEGVAGQSE